MSALNQHLNPNHHTREDLMCSECEIKFWRDEKPLFTQSSNKADSWCFNTKSYKAEIFQDWQPRWGSDPYQAIRLSGACVDDSTVWSPTSTYWRDVGWVTAPPGGGACYLKSIFSRCMSQPGVLLLCSRRQSELLSLHCNWYWQKKNNELEHLWYLQISIRVTKVIWKKKSFRNDLLRHL